MSSEQDRTRRDRGAARHEAGTGIAIGAAVVGLAGLAWALVRKKKIIGEDDSPIIIKSGSLSVYVKDANGKIDRNNELYRVTSTDFTGMKEWDVSVVELQAGFPVSGPTPFTKVSSVVLSVVADESGTAVDTITITFDSAGEALNVAAANDGRFGDKTDKRKVGGSRRHQVRAISKEINGEKNFLVGKLTVNYAGESEDFDSGYDYAVACTFHPRRP